jgi:hypothetical protein
MHSMKFKSYCTSDGGVIDENVLGGADGSARSLWPPRCPGVLASPQLFFSLSSTCCPILIAVVLSPESSSHSTQLLPIYMTYCKSSLWVAGAPSHRILATRLP